MLCANYGHALHVYTISMKITPTWNLVEEIQLLSVRAESGITLFLKENLHDFV